MSEIIQVTVIIFTVLIFAELVTLMFYLDINQRTMHTKGFTDVGDCILVLGWGEELEPHEMHKDKTHDGWFHVQLAKTKSFDVCYSMGYLDRNQYCCNFTLNRTLYAQSEVVLLRGWMFNELEPPTTRSGNQKWVFVEDEPPGHLAISRGVNVSTYDKLFNLTSTYTMDSDIPRPEFAKRCWKSSKRLKEMERVDFTKKKRTDILAAGIVSNCDTQSNLSAYVLELQKYMDVDIYGICGNKTCGTRDTWHSSNCVQNLFHGNHSYKFYLAFENSFCDEYLSEKMWKLSNVDVVPIVMGAANYSAMLPKEAYIDSADFQSPIDLAKYLHYVNRNSTLYNKYVRTWRSLQCESLESRIPWECRLCKLLHDNRDKRNVVPSLKAFWGVQSRCRTFQDVQNDHIRN